MAERSAGKLFYKGSWLADLLDNSAEGEEFPAVASGLGCGVKERVVGAFGDVTRGF